MPAERRRRLGERGAILLKGVLILSLVVVAGILSFLAITTMRYRATDHRAKALQARLWSESGIQDAVNRVRHDPFWRADGTETFPALSKTFDEGGYEVLATVAIPPNHLEIRSTGSSSWLKREVHQEVLFDFPTLFALVAAENVRLTGNASVEGAISAGKNIMLAGDAVIAGPVQVRENFNGPIRAASGPIYEQFSSVIQPRFDIAPYVSGTYFSLFGGPLSNLTLSDTVLFIAGSSEITGLHMTNGVLVVEGDLRVSGPCRIEGAAGRMALVVTGNLTVEERGSLSVQGPVYVFRDFKARGKAVVEGTVMAANIELGSESRVRPQLEAVYGPIQGLERSVTRGAYREGI